MSICTCGQRLQRPPKKRRFQTPSFQVIVQATGNALTKAVTAAEADFECRTPFWMKGFPFFVQTHLYYLNPNFERLTLFSRAFGKCCLQLSSPWMDFSTSKPATRTIRVSVHRWYIKNELITCELWRSILCMCMFATYFVIDVVVCMMCILIMCHNMCKTWTSWFPPGYQEAFQGTAPNHRAEDGRTVVTGWWMRTLNGNRSLFSWETYRF